MKNKIICLGLIASLLACTCTACNIAGTEFVLDLQSETNKSILTINNVECDMAEARVYLLNYSRVYGNQYGINLWKYEFKGESLEKYVKDVTIDELVNIYCMDQIAEAEELSLDNDEEKLVSSAAKEYYNSLSEAELDYVDISEKEMITTFRHYALAQKLYNSLTEGVDTEVSDDDARVIRIHQIYVTTENNAKQVEKKLKAGEDFDTIAATFNEASVVETTISRGDYPAEVDAIAFELDNDAVSERIKTSEGYYFIKCISKFEEELTEANKANILIAREQEQFNEAYSEFMDSAVICLDEKEWATVRVGDVEDSGAASFFDAYDKYFTK